MTRTNQAKGSPRMTPKFGKVKRALNLVKKARSLHYKVKKQRATTKMKTEQVIPTVQLPQELISEILVWLPVKFILRFRCVSKSFCAIIDSKDFIKMQLNKSSENKIHRKLLFKDNFLLPKRGFYVRDFDDDGFKENIVLKSPRQTESHELYSYCNGLFLLYAKECSLALWNPSTKQCRNLPCCPLEKPQISNPYYAICGMGLGYDSTTDDYKVVLIHHNSSIKCQAWIFGLKTSSWRRVEDFLDIHHYGSKFTCFAHGALHWLYKPNRKRSQDQHIVAFDMEKETFSQVAQPVYPSDGYITGIHVLDEGLCISFFSNSVQKEAILYVRRKDGAEFTWSILYSVTSFELPKFLQINRFRKVRVFGYLKEGDKILLDFGFAFMVSYDFKERYFAKTEIIGEGRYCNPVMLCESLVSIEST